MRIFFRTCHPQLIFQPGSRFPYPSVVFQRFMRFSLSTMQICMDRMRHSKSTQLLGLAMWIHLNLNFWCSQLHFCSSCSSLTRLNFSYPKTIHHLRTSHPSNPLYHSPYSFQLLLSLNSLLLLQSSMSIPVSSCIMSSQHYSLIFL